MQFDGAGGKGGFSITSTSWIDEEEIEMKDISSSKVDEDDDDDEHDEHTCSSNLIFFLKRSWWKCVKAMCRRLCRQSTEKYLR